MRYITNIDDLVLYKNDGTAAYTFGPHGILIVGTATGTGAANEIFADAIPADTDDQLQLLWAADLDGNAASRIEMAGQGTLDNLTYTAAGLAVLTDGFWRMFFEAPPIAGGVATSAVLNVKYGVLTGTILYNGVTYTKGQTFKVVAGQTATVGANSTYALQIPDELLNVCATFRDALFQVKNMKEGDEDAGHFLWTNGGFTPKDSLACASSRYVGWLR